jgi:tRNA U34 5-carboxymethylaminomethyl modifying GTPase MnmE/TrmE
MSDDRLSNDFNRPSLGAGFDLLGQEEVEGHHKWLAAIQEHLAETGLDQNSEIGTGIHLMKDRIANPTCRIALIGRIKAGKSTLINALLGIGLTSRDFAPHTSNITRIRQGSQFELLWKERANPDDICRCSHESIESLRDHLYEFTGANGKRVQEVMDILVTLPMREWSLPAGVEIVDTPGLSDPDPERSKLTRDYLAQADAVIFVFSAPEMLDSEDLKELESLYTLLGRHQERIFFAANKIDAAPQGMESWEHSMTKGGVNGSQTMGEFIIGQLGTPPELNDVNRTSLRERVFPLSALAFLYSNPALLLDPGESANPGQVRKKKRLFEVTMDLEELDYEDEVVVAEKSGIQAIRSKLGAFLNQDAIQRWREDCLSKRQGLKDLITRLAIREIESKAELIRESRLEIGERQKQREVHEIRYRKIESEIQQIRQNMQVIDQVKSEIFTQLDEAKSSALESILSLRLDQGTV